MAVVALLMVLSVVPLLFMLTASVQPGGGLPFPPHGFTLEKWQLVFSDPLTYRLFMNTMVYAIGSMLVGMTLAFILSWLLGRTDMPFSGAIYMLALAAFAMPGAVTAFGWVLLLQPRTGVINLFVRFIFRSEATEGPFNVFTMPGMIAITGISLASSMFIFLVPMFRRMDPALDEAATTSGANRLMILRRVSLPLLMPGLLTVAVYYSVIMIQIFEFPLAIGLRAHIPVLSTRVYLQTQPEFGLVDYGLAAVFAGIALVIGIALLALYFRLTRREAKYQVITGRGYRPTRVKLGRWKYLALVFTFGLFFIKIGLPLITLGWASLIPFYQPPSMSALEFVSLDNYTRVFSSERVRSSLFNTVILVLSASTFSMLLASLIAWLSLRVKVRGTKLLEQLAFIPLAIPGVVSALALLILFVRTPLYGSVWIIVIGHTVGFLPFGVRLMSSSILQIGKELEEVGVTSGAAPLMVFRRVVVPLVAPAVTYGWLWVFAHSVRDFTYPLLFRTPDNPVIASIIWEYWTRPDIPGAAAMAVLLVLAIAIFVVIARKVFALRFGEGAV